MNLYFKMSRQNEPNCAGHHLGSIENPFIFQTLLDPEEIGISFATIALTKERNHCITTEYVRLAVLFIGFLKLKDRFASMSGININLAIVEKGGEAGSWQLINQAQAKQPVHAFVSQFL